MSADVIVGGESSLPGSENQHAFSSHIESEIVTGFGDLRFPSAAEPLLVEDSLLLPPKHLLGEVVVTVEGSFHH
jgi:hypothetical protein